MKMKLVLLLSILFLFSCTAESSKPKFMTSSFPAYAIIKEIAGNKAEVEFLVPPGASPHTYTPKPSDIKKVSLAKAFFYIANNYDGWSAQIPAKLKIQIIDFLPKENKLFFDEPHVHDHGDDHNHSHDSLPNDNDMLDPHFWFDPIAVKAVIPFLVDTLSKIDPENSATYKTNGDLFLKRLDLINKEVSSIVADIEGKSLFLQHPSFLYLARKYNLIYAGSIEEIPGKEPGPRYIADLIKKIKESATPAIFTEPQLNRKTAEVIAKEANVLLFELDPVGGTDKIRNYSDLILQNAKIIRKAFH